MSDFEKLVRCIEAEVDAAVRKFKPFASAQEGWAIIEEELQELREEVRANNLVAARYEAIQVAAMAIRFLMDVKSEEQMQNRINNAPHSV